MKSWRYNSHGMSTRQYKRLKGLKREPSWQYGYDGKCTQYAGRSDNHRTVKSTSTGGLLWKLDNCPSWQLYRSGSTGYRKRHRASGHHIAERRTAQCRCRWGDRKVYRKQKSLMMIKPHKKHMWCIRKDGDMCMQLTKIKIKNYRLLVNAELEVDPKTTLIVGRNNTAKTSCFSCIENVLKKGNDIFWWLSVIKAR